MKQYLILMRGGTVHTDQMTGDEKHKHLKEWGMYLSRLDATGNLIAGFPLHQEGKTMDGSGLRDEKDLDINAYMVLSATGYDEVENHLLSCPFLDHDKANFIIKEVQPAP